MELLAKEHYHKLIEELEGITINNFFALSLVEQKVSGNGFVDNRENPKTFYVNPPLWYIFVV